MAGKMKVFCVVYQRDSVKRWCMVTAKSEPQARKKFYDKSGGNFMQILDCYEDFE